MSDPKIHILPTVYPVESVVQHFINGFEPKEGQEILKVDWFLDPVKKAVVFHVMVKETT